VGKHNIDNMFWFQWIRSIFLYTVEIKSSHRKDFVNARVKRNQKGVQMRGNEFRVSRNTRTVRPCICMSRRLVYIYYNTTFRVHVYINVGSYVYIKNIHIVLCILHI